VRESKSLVREGSSERNPTLCSGEVGNGRESCGGAPRAPPSRLRVCTRGFAPVSVHKREGVRAFSAVAVPPARSLSSTRDEKLSNARELYKFRIPVARNRKRGKDALAMRFPSFSSISAQVAALWLHRFSSISQTAADM